MLGHNKRLEQKLKEHGGKRAWATVLESEQQWASTGGANTAPGQAGSFTIHQKLKLRVEPDGEPPFEVTVKQVFNDVHGQHIPHEGWSVTVTYDPDDHSKAVIDMDKQFIRPGVDREAAVERHERVMQLRDPAARQRYVEEMQARAAAQVQTSQEMVAKALAAAQAGPPRIDVADELTKLAALRDRGVLSDAEFEAQKAKLLSAG
jgi:hypothetical protein